MNNWIPHVTVAAIVEKDIAEQKHFLMVEETINAHLVINQAAGHWEQDESIIDAVVRETLEETSYIVIPRYLTGIYTWTIPQNENTANTKDTFLRFTFYCELGSKTENELDPDINRYLWLSEAELRSTQFRKRSPLVIKSLDDYLNGNQYPLDQFIDIN